MPTITCPCGATAQAAPNANIVAVADATGFHSIWDISNGLSSLWLCGPCAERVLAHWTAILAITKTDMINFSGFAKEMARRERGAKDAS